MNKQRVRDIMTRDVAHAAPETPVHELARLLVDHDITGMPVVRDGEVIGIVTEADLVLQKARLHLPQFISLLDSQLYLEDPDELESEIRKVTGATAEQLMTPDVITIGDDATVEDLATLFEEKHINPVPVVDEHGKLVGIVSRSDIVRMLARESA